MGEARHTVHMPDGTRIEVFGDRYEVHLAKPIVVHRKHWVISLTASEEVRRTMLLAPNEIEKAIECAFKTIPQIIYPDSAND